MSDGKITLTHEELYGQAVESRLQETAAVKIARESFARAASAPERLPIPRGNILYNPIVAMILFGFIGGVLAWGCMVFVQHVLPDSQAQAQAALKSRDDVVVQQALGQISPGRAKNALRILDDESAGNPFYAAAIDPTLTQAQRQQTTDALVLREKLLDVLANLSLYCACGTILSACLGIAQSIGTGKRHEAIILGSVGSLLGLLGGVAVSFGMHPIAALLIWVMPGNSTATVRAIVADAITWSVLGMFFSAAPGLVAFSRRKLLLGLCGGALGGALGEALFHPILLVTHNELVGRLIAIVTIGCVAGTATAVVENAAKRGWLKVVEGLIAGKQFILYRNPTMIGAFPACEIYLFNDRAVTRHHAMIHIRANGFEIENVSSQRTLLNGRPVTRARLRDGDRIRIGRTCFAFQEKTSGRKAK